MLATSNKSQTMVNVGTQIDTKSQTMMAQHLYELRVTTLASTNDGRYGCDCNTTSIEESYVNVEMSGGARLHCVVFPR